MMSLKRLLRDDGSDDDGSDDDPLACPPTKRVNLTGIGLSSPSSDVPVFDQPPWPYVWNDILGSEVNDGAVGLSLSQVQLDASSFFLTQEGIEDWAEQDLASTETPSLIPESPIDDEPVDAIETKLDICFGMIYRAAVRLTGDMSEIDAKLRAGIGDQEHGRYIFNIRKGQEQVDVIFPDCSLFGHLSSHVSKGLEDVVNLPLLRFEVVADIRMAREVIGKVTKAVEAVVRVNINVYGPEETKQMIGQHLSSGKIYLQRPDYFMPDSTYDNPQMIKFPNMEKLYVSNEPILSTSVDSRPEKSDVKEDFQKAINRVYASLTRASRLEMLEGDRQLITKLLPHQQQALDFLNKREKGPILPEYRLWKAVGDEAEGDGWFQHVITRARSRVPPIETGGGILADEMGMGKSLSILALVTRTLGDAHDWQSCRGSQCASATIASSIKRFSRATLVIVPSALLINNWLKEVEIHLDKGTLETLRYHGPRRKEHFRRLEDVDFVITTYHTLATDFSAKDSPLHKIAWFRIVLDEAHTIRRQATTLYRAAADLEANYRWCLTGTPIQNRLEDIGALFAFNRSRPLDAMSMFRRFIVGPFEEGGQRRKDASGRLTMLVDALCLRRMKDLLNLPGVETRIRKLELSPAERQQYDQIKDNMTRRIKQSAGESSSKKMFGIFQAQLQLRIFCNHGTYQHSFSWAKQNILNEREARESAICSMDQGSEIPCSSCRQMGPITDSEKIYKDYAETCAHVFCSECLDADGRGESGNIKSCPLCAPGGNSATTFDTPEDKDGEYFNAEGYSSKMASLINDVRHNLEQTKSIIFSCWTRTLNLIARHLKNKDISFVRIDGECPLTRRQKILDDFAQDPQTRVLIMTTGTGAFGLNLTSANRVFIVEPQWNPSVETQAIARTLRIGQGDSVLVTRYVIERTVEQEMVSQQRKKLKIAEVGGMTQESSRHDDVTTSVGL